MVLGGSGRFLMVFGDFWWFLVVLGGSWRFLVVFGDSWSFLVFLVGF